MSADPNKKSARTFQCRDVLWGAFEQMARDLECSVDYLINEAMKQYARQRSQDGRAPYPAPGREPSQPGAAPAAASAARAPAAGAQAALQAGAARMPAPTGRNPLPPPPPPAAIARAPLSAPMPSGTRSTLPPATRTAPPPLPRGGPMPAPGQRANGFPGAAAQTVALTLVYQGERFPINKDRFVIGRGKQASDLTLKDPNVSRQHAMIEFQNGVYFMVDMGSTNGVEYNGQRVARKQITEGDVFRICDHGLAFTYR
jgi:hypothetical protein